MISIFFTAYSVVLGAVIGSALTVWLWRSEHSELRGKVRSACPGCNRTLAWYELVPIISFCVQRGKCRACQRKIPYWYVMSESGGAVVGLLLAHHYSVNHPSFVSMLGTIFLCLMLYMIGLYDACYQRIPMVPLWLASGVGVFFQVFIAHRTLYSVITTACGVALFFLLQYIVSKGRWIGEGDIWLGALIGIWFSWEYALLGVWLAYVGGAVISLVLLASGRFYKKSTLPLGTFLVLGTFISIFVGDAILAWYLGRLY